MRLKRWVARLALVARRMVAWLLLVSWLLVSRAWAMPRRRFGEVAVWGSFSVLEAAPPEGSGVRMRRCGLRPWLSEPVRCTRVADHDGMNGNVVFISEGVSRSRGEGGAGNDDVVERSPERSQVSTEMVVLMGGALAIVASFVVRAVASYLLL